VEGAGEGNPAGNLELRMVVDSPTTFASRLEGRYCDLVKLDKESHLDPLYDAFKSDVDGLWTYLPVGDIRSKEDMQKALDVIDPEHHFAYTILSKGNGTPIGFLMYLRILNHRKSVEIGYVTYSSTMRRSAIGTETVFLMLQHAFDCGYHRAEWKCDALNTRSSQAALRYGFTYEGFMPYASVYKNRARDTPWFAITVSDWKGRLAGAFQSWLAPGNFDANGAQVQKLEEFTGGISQAKAQAVYPHASKPILNELGQLVGSPVAACQLPAQDCSNPFATSFLETFDLSKHVLPGIEAPPSTALQVFGLCNDEGETLGYVTVLAHSKRTGVIDLEISSLSPETLKKFLSTLLTTAFDQMYRRVSLCISSEDVETLQTAEIAGFHRELVFHGMYPSDRVVLAAFRPGTLF